MEGIPLWVVRIVAAVWVANLAAGMIPGLKYEPQPEINGIFTFVIGGAYMVGRKKETPPTTPPSATEGEKVS